MVLHLFPAEKFTMDYVKKIYELFDESKHKFIVFGQDKKEYQLKKNIKRPGVMFTSTIFQMKKSIEKLVDESDIIICHSLFFKIIDLYLLNSFFVQYEKKICWVIWGKDLYEDYEKSRGLKAYLLIKPIIKEYLRSKLIENMHAFITTGDYEALTERYHVKEDALVLGAQYSYNLLPVIDNGLNSKLQIMVGHSATATCRHIETFLLLKKYVGRIKVFCPLSYPQDEEYIKMVIKSGLEFFGSDFVPMTEFMQYKDYVSFLNTIDIGVFNNSRQQGMGNITNLLYLGKKVYLSKDNTISKSYDKKEYFIFDCDEINNEDFLLPLKEKYIIENRNRIEQKFSDDNFYKEWRRVFEI